MSRDEISITIGCSIKTQSLRFLWFSYFHHLV